MPHPRFFILTSLQSRKNGTQISKIYKIKKIFQRPICFYLDNPENLRNLRPIFFIIS